MTDRVDVRLTALGAERSRVELALARLLRVDAAASAALCAKLPVTLEHALVRDEADSIAQMLRAVGAEVELVAAEAPPSEGGAAHDAGAAPASHATVAQASAAATGFVLHMDPGELGPRTPRRAPAPAPPPPAPAPRPSLRLARTVAEFVPSDALARADEANAPSEPQPPGLVMSADSHDFVRSAPPPKLEAPAHGEVFPFVPPLLTPAERKARDSDRVAATLGLSKQSLPPLPKLETGGLQLPRLLDTPLGLPRAKRDSLHPALRGRDSSIPPALGGGADSVPPALRGDGDSIPPALRGDMDSIPPALRGDMDSIPPALRGPASAPPPSRAKKPSRRTVVAAGTEHAHEAVTAALDSIEGFTSPLGAKLHAWSTQTLAVTAPKRGVIGKPRGAGARTRQELAQFALWLVDSISGAWGALRNTLEARLPPLLGRVGPSLLAAQTKLGIRKKPKVEPKPAAAAVLEDGILPPMPLRRLPQNEPVDEPGMSWPTRGLFVLLGAGMIAHGLSNDASVFQGNASTFSAVLHALAIFGLGLAIWPKPRD